jgi:hypothetical protein
MQVENLIIEYLNLGFQKVKYIKVQNYQMAAEARDKEREKSKEIWRILNPDGEFIDWNTCDKIIDDYCLQAYNCSTYDYALCVKSIERAKKLKDLGI